MSKKGAEFSGDRASTHLLATNAPYWELLRCHRAVNAIHADWTRRITFDNRSASDRCSTGLLDIDVRTAQYKLKHDAPAAFGPDALHFAG